MRLRELFRLALIAGVSLSCGDGTGTVLPDPGPVNLVLTTPNNSDGALLLDITGGAVTSVQTQGYELAATPPGTGLRMLVRGNLVAGPIATLIVPDRHKLGKYTVTVLQAAARGTYQQLPLAGYAVRLAVP
ncbi:MAG: hypothetical protein ABI742_08605 [Gemmatimonadota bacterium]